MKMHIVALLMVVGIAGILFATLGWNWKHEPQQKTDHLEKRHLYEFSMKTIEGEERELSFYRGKVLMIVNVASKCGLTPQYADLQRLYETHKNRGFEILAFPANDFLGQEPGSDEDIKEFCSVNYDVTFDLFSKISVTGNEQHPLYRFITQNSSVPGDISWNFQKYLVDRNGTIIAKYSPRTKPFEKDLVATLNELLASEGK